MATEQLRLLLVDDEDDFRMALAEWLSAVPYDVHTASDGIEAINHLQRGHFDAMVLDLQMPRVNGMEVLAYLRERSIQTPVIILTAVHDLHVAVDTIKAGAFDFVTKPVQPPDLLHVVERALERTRLLRENVALRRSLEQLQGESEIVGSSSAIMECLDLAGRVAPTDSTVLIQGPSGSGKELIAGYIHRRSSRAAKPMLALNCSAIPESLLESELFGHEKGAFTDAAAARQGLVEVADGGTLFLDEVGELTMPVQPKLLRFLQTGEYRRVGGNQTRRASVRVVSATNRDLTRDVASGRFREDLLYRLNVLTIQVPALRERPEDIPLLAAYFLRNNIARGRKDMTFSPEAIEALRKYHWPGNVRELQNAVERATILCKGSIISPADLLFGPSSNMSRDSGPSVATPVGAAMTLKAIEGEHIRAVLTNVSWNKKLAAKILGISVKTLYTKLHQHQITNA